MEKITKTVQTHLDKLKYLIITGAVIGLLNTFCRADYNFILYLYMYYIWSYMTEDKKIQAREKLTIFYILKDQLFSSNIYLFFNVNQIGSLNIFP